MTIHADFGKLCRFFKNPVYIYNFLQILANHEDFEKTCGFWQIVRILIKCADFDNFGKSCGFLKNPADFNNSGGFWQNMWILTICVDFGKLCGF